MKKTIIQKEVYITDDGVEFTNEDDAHAHEYKNLILSSLEKRRRVEKINNVFTAVWVADDAGMVEELCKAFKISEKDIRKHDWNLLSDGHNKTFVYSIEDLIKSWSEPKRSSVELSEEEKMGIAQFKKSLVDIIARNTKLQATPEGILGNLIMELQDLLTK